MSVASRLTFYRSADLSQGDDGVPASALDDFHNRLADVTRRDVVARFGLVGLASTAELRRSTWEADPAQHCEGAVAVDGSGRDVGAWAIGVPLRENLETADVEILVPPPSGQIDSAAVSDAVHAALVDDALRAVRRHRRSVVFVHDTAAEVVGTAFSPVVLAGADDGDRFRIVEGASATATIPVRSGTGRLASTDPSVRRMVATGFSPVQIERFSVLDLDAGPSPAPREHGSTDGNDDGIRAISWVDATPPEWAEQMADLYTVFEATVPSGGAAFAPEVWDTPRLREAEATARATGVVRIVTALAEGRRLHSPCCGRGAWCDGCDGCETCDLTTARLH